MSVFQLLRALVRANITLSLAGDKLLATGNLRAIEGLRGPLQTHTATLRDMRG